MRGAPHGGVGLVHLTDELSDFVGDRRPARRIRSALPTPVEAETLPVPAEDGLRLDEDESATPSGPELGEPDPHESIGGPKQDAPSRALALEDEELMAQSEHLGLECGPPAEHGSERCESGQKGRNHRRGSLGQSRKSSITTGQTRFTEGTGPAWGPSPMALVLYMAALAAGYPLVSYRAFRRSGRAVRPALASSPASVDSRGEGAEPT